MSEEKFKKCPSCQNFIPEPAIACMYCGAGQEAAKPVKKKGGLSKILLWLVVAFFGCIVLAVVGSFLGDGEGATTAPADSSGVVVRPTFTPTSEPATATPIPLPTETPMPALVTESNDLALYAQQVMPLLETYSSATDTLSTLFANANAGNQNWGRDVGIQLGLIRVVAMQSREVNPPAIFAEPHQTLVDALALCETASQEIGLALDALDTNKLNQAMSIWVRCDEGIKAATAQLESIIAQ